MTFFAIPKSRYQSSIGRGKNFTFRNELQTETINVMDGSWFLKITARNGGVTGRVYTTKRTKKKVRFFRLLTQIMDPLVSPQIMDHYRYLYRYLSYHDAIVDPS